MDSIQNNTEFSLFLCIPGLEFIQLYIYCATGLACEIPFTGNISEITNTLGLNANTGADGNQFRRAVPWGAGRGERLGKQTAGKISLLLCKGENTASSIQRVRVRAPITQQHLSHSIFSSFLGRMQKPSRRGFFAHLKGRPTPQS